MKQKLISSLGLCMLFSNCGLFTKKVVEEQAPLIPRHVLLGNPEKRF